MAILSRRSPAAAAFALVQAHNAFVKAFVDNATTYAHYDITSTPGGDYQVPTSSSLQVTAATAVDLPTTIALAENLRSVLLTHFVDAVAHKGSDTTNQALITVGTVPTAVDQGTVNTLLNALKTALNAHFTQASTHSHNDTTNTVSTANATNLATSEALANALATAVNAHILLAPGSVAINFQPA